MQSYVYGIIIDCVYYDVGNETTTEISIVVERINEDYLSIYIIQFLHADSISLIPPRARHPTLRKLL